MQRSLVCCPWASLHWVLRQLIEALPVDLQTVEVMSELQVSGCGIAEALPATGEAGRCEVGC